MAVVIEAFTILVRNATLESKYPGGREAFARDCPNQTYCNDGALSRVAFMDSRDVQAFLQLLGKKGLTPSVEGRVVDAAVVSSSHGLHAHTCEWLVFATYQGVPVAWLDGTTPTSIVGPPGYELGRSSSFITAAEASERLEYLRTENEIQVYRDKKTGKEMYVGRQGGRGLWGNKASSRPPEPEDTQTRP